MDRQRVLELALNELQRQRAGIDEEIETLRNELKGTEAPIWQMTSAVTRRGRKRTAAERKAQAQRMRKYWAKKKAQTAKLAVAAKTTSAAANTKTRSMTAAHKKALSLKMREIWKKRKAAAAAKKA
jgi:hypothetical protein